MTRIFFSFLKFFIFIFIRWEITKRKTSFRIKCVNDGHGCGTRCESNINFFFLHSLSFVEKKHSNYFKYVNIENFILIFNFVWEFHLDAFTFFFLNITFIIDWCKLYHHHHWLIFFQIQWWPVTFIGVHHTIYNQKKRRKYYIFIFVMYESHTCTEMLFFIYCCKNV